MKMKGDFPAYWTQDALETNASSLLSGYLRMHPQYLLQSYVVTPQLKMDIFIESPLHRNRACHGQQVIVQLLPPHKWKNEKKKKNKKKNGNAKKEKETLSLLAKCQTWYDETDQSILSLETLFLQHDNDDVTLQPTGIIIFVHPERMTWIGTLSSKKKKEILFTPREAVHPTVLLKDFPSSIKNMENEWIEIEIMEWKVSDKTPTGKFLNVLGKIGDRETERARILMQCRITPDVFEENVVDEIYERLNLVREKTTSNSMSISSMSNSSEKPTMSNSGKPTTKPWKIPANEIAKRRDLRQTRIFSIDPTTARDLDDAMHITNHPNSPLVEVGVHIADVSYFVPEGSLVDAAAFTRGTTTYLVDTVLPMLPRVLCEKLCSLNPNVDRLAFSVIWKMNKKSGEIVGSPWFGKSVIASKAKLDYATAQTYLKKKMPKKTSPLTRKIAEDIQLLHSIASIVRKKRFKKGAITLNRPKLSFRVTEEKVEMSTYTILDTHHLVEEFMLMTNGLVAHALAAAFPTGAFLRHHPPPHDGRLSQLQLQLAKYGLKKSTTSQELSASLFHISKNQPEHISAAIQYMVQGPMQRAQYTLPKDTATRGVHHYALNVKCYTHFTSPIRRYADLIVHRQLSKLLASSEQPLKPELNEPKNLQPVSSRPSGVSTKKQMKDLTTSAARMNLETKQSSEESDSESFEESEEQILLNSQVEQCNMCNASSKNAQEASLEVYLALFIQQQPDGRIEVSGTIIGYGRASFSVFFPTLNLETRIFHAQFKEYTITSRKDGYLWKLNNKDEDSSGLIIELFARLDFYLTVQRTAMGLKVMYHLV